MRIKIILKIENLQSIIRICPTILTQCTKDKGFINSTQYIPLIQVV
jgi:hypothetical protein